MKELVGEGQVIGDNDLDDNQGLITNFGDEISSVMMSAVADPGGPYTGDEGSLIPLNAANLCYRDDDAAFT